MSLLHNHIDFNSFFKQSPKKINDDFGVSFITGYQGSGKTYFAVYVAFKYINPDRIIYTNIKSLNLPQRYIIYFETIDEIINNIEMDCVFIIDEISKKYTKECRQDKLFYSWLQQSRKRRRTVLLITQEYLQIPTWLRGICRFVYTTSKIKFFPIFVTYKGFAVLDPVSLEWNVEPLEKYIYKRNKCISSLYDTMEPINVL